MQSLCNADALAPAPFFWNLVVSGLSGKWHGVEEARKGHLSDQIAQIRTS